MSNPTQAQKKSTNWLGGELVEFASINKEVVAVIKTPDYGAAPGKYKLDFVNEDELAKRIDRAQNALDMPQITTPHSPSPEAQKKKALEDLGFYNDVLDKMQKAESAPDKLRKFDSEKEYKLPDQSGQGVKMAPGLTEEQKRKLERLDSLDNEDDEKPVKKGQKKKPGGEEPDTEQAAAFTPKAVALKI